VLDGFRSWLAYQVAPPHVRAASDDFLSAVLGGGTLGIGTAPLRSTAELLDAYSRMPWLRAVVHKVSHSVATTTWRLMFVRDAGGRAVRVSRLQRGSHRSRQRLMREVSLRRDVELVEIEDHPLLDLINTGTPIFPGTTSSQLVQAHMDLVGEAFQLKERASRLVSERTRQGVVTSLLPVPPHWVRSLPTRDRPFYDVQFGRSGIPEPIPQEDVIYYRDPNPRDPFGRGSGTARSLGDELQANEAASVTIRTRLENNSIPPFLAMPDSEGGSSIESKQLERVREDWQRRLRGPTKGAGLVHFLRTRFKIERLGNTFEELSLIPLLQNQRDTIIQVYGIPPEMLGVIENSNRATIEMAEVLYARHVLLPRLELRRAVLQQSLVPEFDERLILDFDSPVPDDREFELSVIKAAPWAFQADEIRARAGEEPLPDDDGKVHAVPSNLFMQPTLSGEEPPEEDEEPED